MSSVDLKLEIRNERVKIHTTEVVKKLLTTWFTVMDPDRFFNKKFKSNKWSGGIKFYDPISSTIKTGLLPYFLSKVKMKSEVVKLKFNIEITDLRGISTEDVECRKDLLEGVTLRDSQVRGVTRLLSHPALPGRGILIGFTGCFTGDTKISLLDGTERSFEELYKEGKKEFWVYSSREDGLVEASRVYGGVQLTKYVTELVEVTLDNGEKVRCTPEHQWMLRDGSYKEAKDLGEGESLMSLCKDEGLMVDFTSTIILEESVPVYDITVPGNHNFALSSGVFVHNCGKSEILCAATKLLDKKTLLIAPDTMLALQLHERLLKRGINSYLFRGNTKDLENSKVIVSNIQQLYAKYKKSLVSGYEESEFVKYLREVEVVLIDEVQFSSASSYVELLGELTKASYRLGVSATPFKASAIDDLNLMSEIGTVVDKITVEELLNEGAIALPEYFFIEGVNYKNKPTILKELNEEIIEHNKDSLERKPLKRSVGYSEVYNTNIVTNITRNRKVVEVCKMFSDEGLRSLVFVSRVDHGRILERMIRSEGIPCAFLSGEDKLDKRVKEKEKFESGEYKALIVTQIFNAGVDLDGGTEAVILASGGKSRVSLIQRTGRGARLQGDGFNKVCVVDFADRGTYLKNHSDQRIGFLEYYRFEPELIQDLSSIRKHIEERINYRRNADG